MDSPDYSDRIRTEFAELLATLPLEWGDGVRREVQVLAEAGEFGLALETLAFAAVEERLPVPPEPMTRIDDLAARMRLDSSEAIRGLRQRQTVGA